MPDAVDQPLVVPWLAQRDDPRVGNRQSAECRVIVERNRMIDPQGEQYLSLHVGRLGIHFAVDENRRHLGDGVPGCLRGGEYLQGDRIAAHAIQIDRRHHHEPGSLRHEGDDPAGHGLGAALDLRHQAQLP
jgi:hypothetical protein